MRSPTLAELPAPPEGRTGWPWTTETPPITAFLHDTRQWPRVSVVTPSFNQGEFIEETIRSVLLQGYPDLEYVVIDGGSSDDSVRIIQKYSQWIHYWVSEPDKGQADAIQKGFNHITGTVSAYLNSDDIYMEGAIQHAAVLFRKRPELDFVYGNLYRIDQDDNVTEEHRNTPFMRWGYLYGGFYLHQPSTFWKTAIVRQVGGFNPEFRFDMDNDLFVRIAMARARFGFVRAFLAGFRVHASSKTSTIIHVSRAENIKIRERYLPFPFKSFRGGLIRTVSFFRRLCWYAIQGDLLWLGRRALSKTSRMRGA